MSHPTKPLIQAIRKLHAISLLNNSLLDLAEKSPTKFMREATKILSQENGNVRQFNFRSYDKDCTLFIDIRWIPFIRMASGTNKITAIKAIRCVAGYSLSDAVPYDPTKDPTSMYWQNNGGRNGAGLADAKTATEGGIPGIFGY